MCTQAHQTSLPGQVHGRGLGIPSWGGVSPAIPQNHTSTYSPLLIAGVSFQRWLRRQALPPTSCETLDKLLSFLEPQFPHLLNGDHEVPISRSDWGNHWDSAIKPFEQCLGQSKHSLKASPKTIVKIVKVHQWCCVALRIKQLSTPWPTFWHRLSLLSLPCISTTTCPLWPYTWTTLAFSLQAMPCVHQLRACGHAVPSAECCATGQWSDKDIKRIPH